MALQCFVDAFNIGTGAVASTVVRTGYGFQPKACLYWWSGRTESTNVSGFTGDVKPGFGVACSATDRRCISAQMDDGAGTMATDGKHNDAQMIECLTIAGALDGNADLQSFDSDGQTLVIDDQFTTSLRVHCLALGGSDLTNAETFQFQAPGSTGTQDIGSLSFQPSAIVLFSAGITTAPPSTAVHSRYSLGFATGSSAQGVCASMDVDATNSDQSGRYGISSECLAFFANATTVTGRASFVQFLSNGFRLTWSEIPASTPYIFGVALAGGQYSVGQFLQSAVANGTTVAETGVGFTPTGLLLASAYLGESTADTPTAHYQWNVGAAAGTANRAAQGIAGRNAAASATIASCTRGDCMLVGSDAAGVAGSEGQVDLQSFDGDGFTAIMDARASGSWWTTYLAFGSSGGAPPTPAILRQMLHQHGG